MTVLQEHLYQELRTGRPQILINTEDLLFLFWNGFDLSGMASVLKCSARTVRRRLQEMGLSIRSRYTCLSDNELDKRIMEIQHCQPNRGSRMVEGILRSQHIIVQRRRVRQSLQRVNPEGIERRCRRALHRRTYNVRSPNSLWHIDGFHKLVRWHIVIHGGIDRFSRLIVYLQAANNNKAETVLQCFCDSIGIYGLPSRVRSDMGGENVLIAEFMLQHPHRGPGRSSAITGRSIHNQRIERLWRDLFTECISHYYHLFYVMEEIGILNPDSELDIYLLQLLYIPEINEQLHIFQNGWNNHKIRTARNKTSIQLWINGIIERYGDIPLITDSIEEVSLTHAVLYVLLVIIIVKLLLIFRIMYSCCILP